MALLNLTQTSSGSSFSLDENNVLKIYNNGSKNIVEYLDVVKGLKKQMEVDEAPAAIFALASNMVSTTSEGATVYLNAGRVTTVSEINSLAIVKYDEGTETSATINLDVDKATFEAGMPTPGGDSSAFKVYSAMVTQSATSDPVAVVLENTLGGTVVWTRDSVGNYSATLSGAFTANKTIFPSFLAPNYEDKAVVMSVSADVQNVDGVINMYRSDINSVVLETSLTASGYAEFSTVLGTSSLFIEIRVYN